MLKILRFLKPYWFFLVILMAFTLVQVWATLQLPDYLARIINDGIIKQDQAAIWRIGGLMILVAIGGGICTVVAGYLSSRVGMGATRDMRKELFEKIESFSITEFNKYSTSSLITRSTNDVQQIQTVFIMFFRMVLAAPITAVVAIMKAYNTAPSMNWIMVVAVLVLITVISTIFSFAIPKFQLIQKLTDKLNLVVRESLTGIRVIRAFNNQQREEAKISAVNGDLTDASLFVNRITSLLQPFMFLIMNIAAISIIWFGSHLISTNDLGIGNMLAFMQYALQVIVSFLMITIVFIMIPRAAVSANRILEIFATKLTITDPKKPIKDMHKKGEVTFSGVNFGYNNADELVLENITFTAQPGKTTAIIGSTGSGKSTLVSLIPRLYDVTAGSICIDGVDVKEMSQADLHELVGYVPQKAVLFSGTISENIKYGRPDATEDEVVRAADISQAAEFIGSLPEKYETYVSQDGTNLSGGQKQRIVIARALIKDAPVYLFDDSFSALDFKTDAALRQALFSQMKNKTIIIVAQRINTILHADTIIVLDQGRIVGEGTHRELMKSCNVYKEIVNSQLSEKEITHSLAV